MEDLPDLAFEQVLKHLSLNDRLRARSVSKRWRQRFDFEVKSLCFSDRPVPFIMGNARHVSGEFARNFISCTRFTSFFTIFGQTILSNLKHLRICDLQLNEEILAVFASVLQSFSRLERLDLIRLDCSLGYFENKLDLKLPVLQSIHLQSLLFNKLTVEASRLEEITFLGCSCNLDIVHGESVKKLITHDMKGIPVKKLENLQLLFLGNYIEIEPPAFLSSLLQLREIHLNRPDIVAVLFDQKQMYGLAELKIYFLGLLLNGPDDPAIALSLDYYQDFFFNSIQNRFRLANELPPFWLPRYSDIERNIERVAPGLELNFLIMSSEMDVDQPIQDDQRFLDLIKNFGVVGLFFRAQPQYLFDRLPDYQCAIPFLSINRALSDFQFLFRLRKLNRLCLNFTIDLQLVRQVFEELPFFFFFEFKYKTNQISIELTTPWLKKIYNPNEFVVTFFDTEQESFATLNDAIHFITDDLGPTMWDLDSEEFSD